VLNCVPTIASVLVSVVLLYCWAPHLIQLSELGFVYNAQFLDFLESNVDSDREITVERVSTIPIFKRATTAGLAVWHSKVSWPLFVAVEDLD
jgi:hypothetical protein